MVVVLQVLCHYEFMIEMGPLMSENQVKKSLSYVAFPHLTRLGEAVLHLATKLALYLSTCPLPSCLVLNTHFHRIGLQLSGKSTKLHTILYNMEVISSFIASIQKLD